VVAWPVARTIWLSLHKVESPLPTAPSTWVGFDNYTRALGNPDLWAAVARTGYFTVLSTGLELVFGILLGLLMAQKLRARWLLRIAVIIPWALPTIVNATMWRYVYNPQYGPLNAVLTQTHLIDEYRSWLGSPFLALNMVILSDVWKNTSVVAFFVLAGLQVIPGEIMEAAQMDGAGAIRRFWSITLPLLRPIIAIVLVLRTIEAFKVFDLVYVMTRGGPANGTQTVALLTYQTAFSDQYFGYGSALSVLIVIVIMILAVTYMRMLRVEESRTAT
jgi:multiple sugar transport system permease protein/N,N'-diacetylchitobiose transport system permease protein